MNEHQYDLAITGSILQGDQFLDGATLLIKKGKVASIATEMSNCIVAEQIQADGKYILPGAIDSHVHSLSYPGEGVANATRSAYAGGVTTIVDIPVDAQIGRAHV